MQRETQGCIIRVGTFQTQPKLWTTNDQSFINYVFVMMFSKDPEKLRLESFRELNV
jgi:hypothetical protein